MSARDVVGWREVWVAVGMGEDGWWVRVEVIMKAVMSVGGDD